MSQKVLLYVPNIIDYLRIILLFASVFFKGTKFTVLYGLSVSLDYFDGMLARSLNQVSLVGGVLDMIIDRVSTMTILTKIAIEKIEYAPWCILYSIIDFMSHFVFFLVSAYTGIHHKKFSTNYFLSLYYTPAALYLVCLGSELCFLTTYNSKGKKNIFKFLQGIAVLKTFFHIVHFGVGLVELAKLPVN
ncbi:phosphatidylinositol synthase 1 (CDP-alcohol phosphatidyltransferase1) [Glugoides intestinalis]